MMVAAKVLAPVIVVLVSLTAATYAVQDSVEKEVFIYVERFRDLVAVELRVPIGEVNYAYGVEYRTLGNVTGGKVFIRMSNVRPGQFLAAQINLWDYGEYFEIQGNVRLNVSGSRIDFAIIPANVSWASGGVVELYPFYESEEALREADYARAFGKVLSLISIEVADAGNYTIRLTPVKRIAGTVSINVGFGQEAGVWMFITEFSLDNVRGDVRDLLKKFYLGVQELFGFDAPEPPKWPWDLLAPGLPFTEASVNVYQRNGLLTYSWAGKGISAEKIRAALQYLVEAGYADKDTKALLIVIERQGTTISMRVADAMSITDEYLASIHPEASGQSGTATAARTRPTDRSTSIRPVGEERNTVEGLVIVAIILAVILAGLLIVIRTRR